MDSFLQCHYCNKHLTSPLELICRHSYCTDCLTKEIRNEKIICPICATEHPTPAASLSAAKLDKLSFYLIDLNSGTSYSTITDDSPAAIHAECAGCKTITDLRKCFHCEKPLCPSCRTQHYELQKKDVDQSIHNLVNKTNELIVVAQALNTSRTNRIQEYKLMKDKISAHVNELIKLIHEEEENLQKQVGTRILFETGRIDTTELEKEYLQKNKAALDEIADKYRNEKNQMVAIKMHKDYLDTAPNWKDKLENYAGRINEKKEQELHFQPTQPEKTDALVGKLINSKNVNIYATTGAHRPVAAAASRSCILM
ncbi:unnamed protein product [Adineta steineri]|uniref:RING-type domain-containing protein n=1 Tax=Adineta steineri TaxID=433720 RepID=A0A813VQZ9_9BILA|nr:unnamed protein product [Adineta steineri]CAF3651106.1 unnamed protein product [Adineta steineri]